MKYSEVKRGKVGQKQKQKQCIYLTYLNVRNKHNINYGTTTYTIQTQPQRNARYYAYVNTDALRFPRVLDMYEMCG